MVQRVGIPLTQWGPVLYFVTGEVNSTKLGYTQSKADLSSTMDGSKRVFEYLSNLHQVDGKVIPSIDSE